MATAEQNFEKVKSAQGRGPSYPSMDLEEAVKKSMLFWQAEKRSPAPVTAAARHWGYSETSSSGKMAVAALIQYGLLEDQGAGEKRTVKLTPQALDIVLDEPDSPNRIKALQAAVWHPKIYSELLSKWPAHELPSDHTLRYFLVREKAYNESAVAGLLKDFRASIAYARMDKPGTIPPEQADSDPLNDGGGERGRQMEEAVMERKQDAPEERRAEPRVTERVEEMAAGEREWMRGKLSKDGTSYRLIVSGELGSKEIGKLIKLLKAQKLVLEDEDEDDDDQDD